MQRNLHFGCRKHIILKSIFFVTSFDSFHIQAYQKWTHSPQLPLYNYKKSIHFEFDNMFNVSFHLPVCVKMKAWHTQEDFKLGHIVLLNFYLILIMSAWIEVSTWWQWWSNQCSMMMTVSRYSLFSLQFVLERRPVLSRSPLLDNLEPVNRFQLAAELWVPWQDKSISFTKSGSQESHYVKRCFPFHLTPVRAA